MEMQSLAARIEQVCGELGLSDSVAKSIEAKALGSEAGEMAEEMKRLAADNASLRAQLNEITSERDRLYNQQGEIAKLISARSREKLLHDLRNVLNELTLLRAITADERT